MSGYVEVRLAEALGIAAEMVARVGELLVANTKLTSQLQAIEARLAEALDHGAEMASRVGDLLVANTKLTSQLQAIEARVRELEAERASLIEGRDANAATYHGHLAAALARAEASEARLAEIEREAERLRDRLAEAEAVAARCGDLLVEVTKLRAARRGFGGIAGRVGGAMAVNRSPLDEDGCCAKCGSQIGSGTAMLEAELTTAEAQLRERDAECELLKGALSEAVEALSDIANVPADGHGQAYYWKGRDVAKDALAKARAALAEKP
jgi:chaperonin cofactor prefoldin